MYLSLSRIATVNNSRKIKVFEQLHNPHDQYHMVVFSSSGTNRIITAILLNYRENCSKKFHLSTSRDIKGME